VYSSDTVCIIMRLAIIESLINGVYTAVLYSDKSVISLSKCDLPEWCLAMQMESGV